MKLTPHEILRHLGFDMPDDGIEINPHDMYLHATLLRLLGQQMRISAIADSELAALHVGLYGVHHGPGAVAPEPTGETIEKLRASLLVMQKRAFGMSVE
ncbi:hypothetical protein KPB05_36425 [Burkholderia gladioli]|uniref:hypothetical protein n=1 Tax=Burkholderia gladioli TaxID=28095 RepID=UPI002857FBD7|nr:hypothetical protein [Burkholderia gladioli]MDR8092946.1 hypothetical protein [Burkholderia gladioli]